MKKATFNVRKINGVANLMQSLGCDKGTVKMMHGMVLQAVQNNSQTIAVDNPAVLGFMKQFGYRVAG